MPHTAHVAPRHWLRHSHTHPGALPETRCALPEQSLASHTRVHDGKPVQPSTQRSHPSDAASAGSRRLVLSPGAHVAHVGPDQRPAHVHAHPLTALPVTRVACALQLASTVHASAHVAATGTKPATHVAQSSVTLNSGGHDAHVAPLHRLRHVHAHPSRELPVTPVARELQLASTVHASAQLGNPLKPASHVSQSAPPKGCGHDSHAAPRHWLRHTQLQLGVKPLTAAARPEHAPALVHAGWHCGYGPKPATHAPQSAAVATFGGHVAQSAPVHALRHVHWHAPGSPVTRSARPLQSATTSHTRVSHVGPAQPGLHVTQSGSSAKLPGHVAHAAPTHALRHVHRQPVARVPRTAVAWNEQFAVVQRSEQLG